VYCQTLFESKLYLKVKRFLKSFKVLSRAVATSPSLIGYVNYHIMLRLEKKRKKKWRTINQSLFEQVAT